MVCHLPEKEEIQTNQNLRNLGIILGVKDKLSDILEKNHILGDVFNYENIGFRVKTVDESSILKNHFKGNPIVPGIVLKKLLLTLIASDNISNKGIKNTTINVNFYNSCVPGDIIYLGDDLKSLYNQKGKKIIDINFTKKSKEDKKESRLTNYLGRTIKKARSYEIDRYLLQTGDFRFVCGSKFIYRKNVDKLSLGDAFEGFYEIPENFNFSKLNDFYSGFYDEIAAQIGSYTMGKYLGELNDNSSKILTFKSSSIEVIDNNLSKSKRIFVTGKVSEIEDKTLGFIFIGRDDLGRILFKGKISGNIIPVKLLQRMNKK